MGSTKKDNKYPNKPAFQLANENENGETEEYIPKPLYSQIANSIHGIGKKFVKEEGGEIIKKDGLENVARVINIELCEWQIPPTDKKDDCEPVQCPPEQEG